MMRSICVRPSRRALARQTQLSLEKLESREVPSGAQPDHIQFLAGGGATPFGSPGPTGYTPAQIRHAYGFDQIKFNGGTVIGDGAGTTIAIVDAFDDPRIANDLHQFDLAFGLPDPVFIKVNQSGGTTMPAADAGWASEIALDVEWAHAIAPKASILLVEANNSSYSNLFAAVSFAARQAGVAAVSMSWGGGEFLGETNYDSVFKTPAGHTGVTFVASSGDSGAPVSYPSVSPNVLSVGGTHLSLDSSGNFLSESGWSGSGGGISSVESQPVYQKGIVTQTTTRRANPDVSYDADPNTGFPVYDSFNNSVSAPWSQFGGTSDAAPQWAALIAIADQGRALAGLGALDGATQTLPALYALPASDFHDITTGSSFGSPVLSAGAGYDLVTGRGSPYANKVVADLAGQSSGQSAVHFTVSTPASAKAGTSFTFTVTAANSSGATITNYLGTIHFTSSDPAAVVPGNYTFTAADKGVHTFTATLKTAGGETITGTDVANSATTGSGAITITPAAASKLVFGQQPTDTVAGVAISPAVTVRELDAYGNLVTSDNATQITVAIGANPAAGTLSGTRIVTVSGGVATFGTLSINNAGNGYTLTAKSGILTSATSSSFSITATGGNGNLIEDFETGGSWNVTGFGGATAFLSSQAAHDGSLGLDDYGGSDWIYRNDAAATVKRGDSISVWLKFNAAADGRAYFGFGASSAGTLSLVAAPNTGQLIIQSNAGFGFVNLAAAPQTYLANHWYRLEVDWGTSGKIIGKLFDSNGTTLLKTVTATNTTVSSGGIAFRATGNDKFWDSVTDKPGVNLFAIRSQPSVAGFIGSPVVSEFGGTAIGPQGEATALYEELWELYSNWARSRKNAFASETFGW
jgi:hypothetical protein